MASKNGHSEVVMFLIQSGSADVNRVDFQGYTALMHASKEGHLNVVQTLVEHGHADVTFASHLVSCKHWIR